MRKIKVVKRDTNIYYVVNGAIYCKYDIVNGIVTSSNFFLNNLFNSDLKAIDFIHSLHKYDIDISVAALIKARVLLDFMFDGISINYVNVNNVTYEFREQIF